MGQDAQGWSCGPNHHGAFDTKWDNIINSPQNIFYSQDMIYPPEY